MSDQNVIMASLIYRMRVHQPGILSGMPEDAEVNVGVVPHLGMPYPYMRYGGLIYCPFSPLTSQKPVGAK